MQGFHEFGKLVIPHLVVIEGLEGNSVLFFVFLPCFDHSLTLMSFKNLYEFFYRAQKQMFGRMFMQLFYIQ